MARLTKTLLFGLTLLLVASCAAVARPVQTDRPVRTKQPEQTKELYLTFDDGPGAATDEVLDVLKANGARATFFAIGRELAARPAPARRALAEGHVVAGHTWSHPNLTELGRAQLAEQLDRSVAAVRAVGSGSRCLRPPYGAVNDTVNEAIESHGLRRELWNIDSRDWRKLDPARVADHLVRSAYPGAVVLMHDGGGDRTRTVEALRDALPRLREHGYDLVPIPGC